MDTWSSSSPSVCLDLFPDGRQVNADRLQCVGVQLARSTVGCSERQLLAWLGGRAGRAADARRGRVGMLVVRVRCRTPASSARQRRMTTKSSAGRWGLAFYQPANHRVRREALRIREGG